MPSPRDQLTRLTRGVRRAVLRRRRPLAAALTAVAVAAGVHATTAPPPPRVAVVVAARDLPSGAVLSGDDLRTARFAPGSVPAGLAPSPLGRTLAGPLRAGEPLTDVRLVGPGLADGLPGLTAVPVRLPDAAMAALLHPGDRVDVVATDPQGSGARTVAAGARVVTVPQEPAGGAGSSGSGLPGRLVVLAVSPTEVEGLSEAAVRDFLTFAYTH